MESIIKEFLNFDNFSNLKYDLQEDLKLTEEEMKLNQSELLRQQYISLMNNPNSIEKQFINKLNQSELLRQQYISLMNNPNSIEKQFINSIEKYINKLLKI